MRFRTISAVGALVAAVVTLIARIVRASYFDGQPGSPWWSALVFFGVYAVFVVVFFFTYVREHFARETFFCEDCGAEFEPSTAKLATSFRAGDKWRMKCPGCGKRTVCLMKEDMTGG